jgi:hypothetical protein
MSFGDTTQHKFWSHSGVLNATSEQIQRLEEDNSNDGYEHFSAKKNQTIFVRHRIPPFSIPGISKATVLFIVLPLASKCHAPSFFFHSSQRESSIQVQEFPLGHPQRHISSGEWNQ